MCGRSRKRLSAPKGGQCAGNHLAGVMTKRVEGIAAIVEFENRDAFQAMHSSPAHDKAGERVMPLFDGSPTPHFYEVVIG